VQAELTLKVGNRYVSGSAVPQEFIDFGVRGIRAYAYMVGNEAAQRQISLGNELAGVFVDGRKGSSPETMQRNITWEFSHSSGLLIRAVEDALDRLRQLSSTWAARPSGGMSGSWALYINGVRSEPTALANAKRGDDIRVTSPEKYARFLEAGHWGGTKSLKKRLNRVERRMAGRRVRGKVAITATVALALSRKYKSLIVSDVWYETNPFGHDFGNGQRWPAIKFMVRKNLNG
jgi:hypothetical protein